MPLQNELEKPSRVMPSPLWKQLLQILTGEILAHHLVPGEKLPGMAELARRFEVSTMTVNLALNELIRQGRCVRLPKKGTVVRSAELSAHRKNGTILTFASSPDAEYNFTSSPFFRHLHSAAENYPGISLLSVSGARAQEMLSGYLAGHGEEVSGVIFLVVETLEPVLTFARKYPQHNFVLLNLDFDGFDELAPPNVRGVFNDEFCGGYMAATRLLAAGCRRPGILYYKVSDRNYTLRIRGFLRAFTDAGVQPEARLQYNTGIALPPLERGVKGAEFLLNLQRGPDSLFCVNDLLAAGAVQYLRGRNGLENLPVIGYDNHIPDLHKSNGFATISIRTDLMSRAAAGMLCEPEAYPVRKLLIEPELLI